MMLGSFFKPVKSISTEAVRTLIREKGTVEDGSRKFLDAMKERCQAPDICPVLDRLIAHKESHQAALSGLHGQISGPADDFPASVLDRPPREVMAGCVGVSEAITWASGRPLADVLDLMMSLEANTYDLYLKSGRQVTSEAAKSVFARLSEEQVTHLEQLGPVFEKSLF